MQPHKLKMYIRNLEGLVKALRNTGNEISADMLQMEINFIKEDMECDEHERVS